MHEETCDILILGGGGAALYAAIKAHDANPNLKIVLASKGLIAKVAVREWSRVDITLF